MGTLERFFSSMTFDSTLLLALIAYAWKIDRRVARLERRLDAHLTNDELHNDQILRLARKEGG